MTYMLELVEKVTRTVLISISYVQEAKKRCGEYFLKSKSNS